MHNIEKSKFQKDLYVGYGGGAVWHIRKYRKGNWKAVPQDNNSHIVFACATLRDVSSQLETLNALKTDPQTGKRQNNPAKRQAFPNVATATRALKEAEKALADNPNMWPGAAAGFKTVITKANKYLAENSQTHKTNPAPRKRAISRPSQITKKAPSKRLVARRKLAAKKPVKGYFPNPDKSRQLATATVEIDRGKGWEIYEIIQAPGKINTGKMAIFNARHTAKLRPDWRIRVLTK